MDFKSQLINVSFYIDSNVFVAQRTVVKSKWTIYEIWKIGPGSSISENEVGFWTPSGLNLVDLSQKYGRRKDMKGYQIRVITGKSIPSLNFVQRDTVKNVEERFVYHIWETLQIQLNFTYTSATPISSYEEMVTLLVEDKFDVIVSMLLINLKQADKIDFTLPFKNFRTRMYIKRPVLDISWGVYFLPFNLTLWICIPMSIFATAFVLWFLNWIAMTKLANLEDEKIPFAKSLWLSFSGFIQQSTDKKPKSLALQLTLIICYVLGLILITCYSAVLVSILTTVKPQLPFRDFEELNNEHGWSLGVAANTSLYDELRLAPDGSVLNKVWRKNVMRNRRKNILSNIDEGLEKAYKGNFAFLWLPSSVNVIFQNPNYSTFAENLVETGRDLLKGKLGFAVQKNSPFLGIFNHYLLKMISSGQVKRLEHKFWRKIDRSTDHSHPSLGFQQVGTVFMCLAAGIVGSIIMFILETIYKKQRHVSRRKLNAD